MSLSYSELSMPLQAKLSPWLAFVLLGILCPCCLQSTGGALDTYHECTGSPCLILMISAAFSATA